MNLDRSQCNQVTNRKSGSTNPWIKPPRPGTGNGQNGDCDDTNSLLDARNQEPPGDLPELIWVVPPRIICVGNSNSEEWTDLFPAETLFQPQMEQPLRRHVLLDCCGAARSRVRELLHARRTTLFKNTKGELTSPDTNAQYSRRSLDRWAPFLGNRRRTCRQRVSRTPNCRHRSISRAP